MAQISDDLLHRIHDVLQGYANPCSYEPERTGGVLAGCPRGDAPNPHALAAPAATLLRDLESAMRGRPEIPAGKHIRTFPAQDPRIESGPIRFGEDWPGVFLRGDHAAHFAMVLSDLLQSTNERLNPFSLAVLQGLQKTLASARV